VKLFNKSPGRLDSRGRGITKPSKSSLSLVQSLLVSTRDLGNHHKIDLNDLITSTQPVPEAVQCRLRHGEGHDGDGIPLLTAA
jgi:hypothetical protein